MQVLMIDPSVLIFANQEQLIQNPEYLNLSVIRYKILRLTYNKIQNNKIYSQQIISTYSDKSQSSSAVGKPTCNKSVYRLGNNTLNDEITDLG